MIKGDILPREREERGMVQVIKERDRGRGNLQGSLSYLSLRGNVKKQRENSGEAVVGFLNI